MTSVSVALPESVFSALRSDPEEFVREMRLAAAVKWYGMGVLSQGKAAEVAGLTRAEFINSLARFQVSPFQYSAEEVMEAAASADFHTGTTNPEILPIAAEGNRVLD